MLNDPHPCIVISSDCEKSLPFEAQGLTFSSLVPRTSPLSSFVFHAARTLSGSLRSPPSPREEGFVRRYSFSTYACIRSDVMGKAVFSYRSLPYWGRLFLYYVALRSFDSVLIFSDKPFFNTRRFSPLRMTKCAAPLNPEP